MQIETIVHPELIRYTVDNYSTGPGRIKHKITPSPVFLGISSALCLDETRSRLSIRQVSSVSVRKSRGPHVAHDKFGLKATV